MKIRFFNSGPKIIGKNILDPKTIRKIEKKIYKRNERA